MNEHHIEPGSRILVIRPGALGDTILSLAAIRALRRKVGSSGRIELVGYPTPFQLALNPLHADSVHSIDRARFAGLFSETASSELGRFLQRYDWVIAWCRDGGGHLRGMLERLGVHHVQSDPYPPEGSGVHVTDYLMRTLEPVGIAEPATLPHLVLTEEAMAAGKDLLSHVSLSDCRYLAIHAGSGSDRKNWKSEHYAELASMVKGSGFEVLFIKGDADRHATRQVLARLSWDPVVVENLDLPVLAAVTSQAEAYVGNDSGITHLAAAAGIPTWALFGPTDPSIWAPKGTHVHVTSFDRTSRMVWKAIQRACFGER